MSYRVELAGAELGVPSRDARAGLNHGVLLVSLAILDAEEDDK